MANNNGEVNVEGVYGSFDTTGANNITGFNYNTPGINNNNGASNAKELPVKRGFWQSMKAFWLQKIDWNAKIDWTREIKVELTPYQQKVEKEVNDFLHQELTWDGFRKILTGK